MINLTKLNEFKVRVSQFPVPVQESVVQNHQITKIKVSVVESYETYADILGETVDQIEEQLLAVMKRSIDVVLGKDNEPIKTDPEGQALRKLPVSKRKK